MFSRKSGKGRSSKTPTAKAVEVFNSVHIVAERVGPVLCVRVVDEHITERESGILYDETEALIDERCTAIVLDLASVGMLASAGIGAVVKLHKRMGERKGMLAVCGLSTELTELFKLTRMDRLLMVKPDRDAAIAALSS